MCYHGITTIKVGISIAKILCSVFAKDKSPTLEGRTLAATRSQLATSNAKRLLRSSGRRFTRQREAILKIIREQPGHLGADEVFQIARQRGHRVSLSTVYRTLDLLREQGLVEAANLQQDHRHFKAAGDEEHHHLVCVSCDEVIEFSSPHIDRLKEALQDEHRFTIRNVELEVGGLCSDCAAPASG